MSWVCPSCEFENESGDVCEACEEKKPSTSCSAADDDASDSAYDHFKVGIIEECEDVQGAKLKKLKVNVGEKEPLDVVTNAPNVSVGLNVVIACVGATVDGIKIKRTQISGIPSNGVVCDSVMLGWSGGGAGTAAVLPVSCAPGSKPPAQRPRGDTKK